MGFFSPRVVLDKDIYTYSKKDIEWKKKIYHHMVGNLIRKCIEKKVADNLHLWSNILQEARKNKLIRLCRNLKSSTWGFEDNPIRGRVKLVHKGA